MKASGILRKMGAVLQHRLAGFHGNALCCWNIESDRVDEFARKMAAAPIFRMFTFGCLTLSGHIIFIRFFTVIHANNV